MLDYEISDRLISFFDGLLEFYQEFFKLEQDKQKDLETGRLDRLDECMKKEQAYVLRARGLEQERQRLVAQAAPEGALFRDLIPLFARERQERVQSLYEHLSSILFELRRVNRANNLAAENKVRQAAAAIAKIRKQPELRRIYDERLQAGNQPPAFLSKKI